MIMKAKTPVERPVADSDEEQDGPHRSCYPAALELSRLQSQYKEGISAIMAKVEGEDPDAWTMYAASETTAEAFGLRKISPSMSMEVLTHEDGNVWHKGLATVSAEDGVSIVIERRYYSPSEGRTIDNYKPNRISVLCSEWEQVKTLLLALIANVDHMRTLLPGVSPDPMGRLAPDERGRRAERPMLAPDGQENPSPLAASCRSPSRK